MNQLLVSTTKEQQLLWYKAAKQVSHLLSIKEISRLIKHLVEEEIPNINQVI